MTLKTGVVKWFNQVKGHGFITQDDGGPDVFVHHSKVSGKGKDALDQGDLVSYQVHETVKGPAASSVAKR